jgi:hypothetical protein
VNTWVVTNEEQARYWNRGGAVHRLVHEKRYERMRAPFTGRLLTATRQRTRRPGHRHQLWHRVHDPGGRRAAVEGQAGSQAWLVTVSRPWQ